MASPWTNLATNTGTPPAVDDNVHISGGTDVFVRHECLMWLDGTAHIYSKPFDFPITGDFTVILNGTANDITADAGSVDVYVEGSLDGVNYVELHKINDDWNAGGGAEAEAVGHAVYDYDTYGRMPYMRIALDAGGDANCTAAANNVKITIVPHDLT